MVVKRYGEKHGQGGMFFNAILCLFATVYFFVTNTDGFQLPAGVFWYGIVNSVFYATGFYTGFLALSSGSFGLTRLMTSFSAVFPIFYGILVLQDPVSPLTVAGMVLVFVSVILMRYQKRREGEPAGYSVKWVISVAVTVLSNALIAIIGKMQHDTFGDTYKNEYLIVSFLGAALWLTVLGFLFERKNLRATLRHGTLYGVIAGFFNGINNLLSLVVYNYLAISIVSPMKTGLGMLLSFLIALLVYRERFTRRQWAGAAVGTVAILLMNL